MCANDINCMMLQVRGGHKFGTMHTLSHRGAFRIANLSTCKFLDNRKKLKNQEETQAKTRRTYKTPQGQ